MNVNFNGGMPKSVQQKKSFNMAETKSVNESNIVDSQNLNVDPQEGTTVLRTKYVYLDDNDNVVTVVDKGDKERVVYIFDANGNTLATLDYANGKYNDDDREYTTEDLDFIQSKYGVNPPIQP